MAYINFLFLYIIVPLLFYPSYFIVANMIDMIFGEQILMTWFEFMPFTLLFDTFFKDWLNSLLIMFCIFYLLILPTYLFTKWIKIDSFIINALIAVILVLILSLMLGFDSQGLATNTISVVSFVFIYFSSLKFRFIFNHENL